MYPTQPFSRAMSAVTGRGSVVIGATVLWALFYIVIWVAYFIVLFSLDEVAQLPQHQLNRLAFPVVGTALLLTGVVYVSYIAITHARAVECLAGMPLTVGAFFSLRKAGSPLCAYVLSKALTYAPMGAVVAALNLNLEPWLTAVIGVTASLWMLVVGYLTFFATAAATEVGPIRALGRSAVLTTKYPGGTWLAIGVVCLARIAENMTGSLALAATAPYLSFAMVAKYQELQARTQVPAQNFPGGGAGYPVY